MPAEFGVDVLNSIRLNASADYQERIPEATRENIAAIGNALETYTVLKNEFVDALINKIGKTLIEQKLFTNKLSRFKSGAVMSGQDVEEIFVQMATAEGSYDPKGPNPLGRRDPLDTKIIYHRQNRQDYYCQTIGDRDFTRAFHSTATLNSFIATFINAIYSGAAFDEYTAMKNLMATYAGYASYKVSPITGTNAAAAASKFVKTVRKAVNDLSFASNQYNAAGVTTWTDPSDLVLFVHKDVVAEVDVEVLAKAFNMGKTDFQTQIVVMDDFGTLTNTYALLADKDWFRVYDTYSQFESQRNAHGLFTNYFYHVWQILSLSKFKNAVRFEVTA